MELGPGDMPVAVVMAMEGWGPWEKGASAAQGRTAVEASTREGLQSRSLRGKGERVPGRPCSSPSTALQGGRSLVPMTSRGLLRPGSPTLPF